MTANDTSTTGGADLHDCSQLYHHTVPIFDFDRGLPSLRGTGVLVAVDRQRFVITAAHVLESGFRKVAFGFPAARGFEIFGHVDGMNIFTAKAQTGGGDPQRAEYKDGLDLAIIEPIADDVLEPLQSHYRFFDLRQSSYSPVSKWGIVSGWPARANTYDAKKQVCNFKTCYHIQCPIVDTEKVRAAGWNTDIYVGLSADKEKDFVSAISGERIHLPKLEGVSGAGMWVRSSPNNSSPNCTWSLAGIVVEDHESKRMLKVIKIEHVWMPLSQGWGLTN